MKDNGSISILLLIIISVLIIFFISFVDILSIQSFENNSYRSAIITSQNILSQYNRGIYDNYGLLLYRPDKDLEYKNQFINNLDVFVENNNSYKLIEVESIKERIKAKNLIEIEKQIINISNMYVTETIISETLEHFNTFQKIENVKKNILDTKDLKKLIFDFNNINEKIKNSNGRWKIGKYKNEIIQLKNIVSRIDIEISRKIDQISQSNNPIANNYIKNLLDERNKFSVIHKMLEEIIYSLEHEKGQQTYTLFQDYLDFIKGNNIHIDFLNIKISDFKDFINFSKDTIEPNEIVFEGTLDNNIDKNILLNEYLLGVLKTKYHSNHREYDFMKVKNDRDSVINSEIEFIINGHRQTRINEINVLSKIFAIRELANLIHIYSSQDKMKYLNSLNLFGPGSSIVKHGIIVLWSAAESVCDLKKLIDGKGTPLIKLDDNHWNLSIKKIENNNFEINNQLDDDKDLIYYHDYLRLLLLTLTNELKIKRLFQIINANFKGDYKLEEMILKHQFKYNLKLKNKSIQKYKNISIEFTGGYLDE